LSLLIRAALELDYARVALSIRSGILAKQNAVAGLDVEREDLAFIVQQSFRTLQRSALM
jgi:hypothetical protein